MNGFATGMKLVTNYDKFNECKDSLSYLLDDFYFLNVNRTNSTTGMTQRNVYEGQFLYSSKIVATFYRDTMYKCFLFAQQVQSKAKTDNARFLNDEDRFTSFLFNMLGNSYEIRANSENLIRYSEAQDWVNYAKAFGGLIEDLIYFTSSSAASLESGDEDFLPFELDATQL